MDDLTPHDHAVLDLLDRELTRRFEELPRLVLDKSSSSRDLALALVEALTLHEEGNSGAAVGLLLRDAPTDRTIGCLLGLVNGLLKRVNETPVTLAARLNQME